MKIIFDENLSYRIVNRIKSVYPEAIHVDQVGLPERPGDPLIWKWARENDYLVVVSQDSDFVDLLDRHGPPPKVIHLRFGNQRVATTAQFFLDHFKVISTFLEDEEHSLLEILSLD
jgi:predicted nuclease of predicted toxin-antitoxin system